MFYPPIAGGPDLILLHVWPAPYNTRSLPRLRQVFLSLTLHERNLLSLDFLENISKAATTLFLEQKEKKKTKVPPQVTQHQEKVSQGVRDGNPVGCCRCL